jgi:hypothetical protein
MGGRAAGALGPGAGRPGSEVVLEAENEHG